MERFDRELTEEEKGIVQEMQERRQFFNEQLKQQNIVGWFTCVSCGFPTIFEPVGYDICPIAECDWEDDGQDDENADLIMGGPNGRYSLTEYRLKTGLALRETSSAHGKEFTRDVNKIFSAIQRSERRQSTLDLRHKRSDHPDWMTWRQYRSDITFDILE